MKRRSCSAATFPDDIHFLQLTPNRAPDASRDPARPQASSRLNDLGRVAGGKTLRKCFIQRGLGPVPGDALLPLAELFGSRLGLIFRSAEHTYELQSLMRI